MGRLSSQVMDFRTGLIRERARADRTEQEFSVLVLEGQANLIHMLEERLRNTDEIGWFDKQRIGVLLPNTPANGAVKLAQDIRRMTMPSPPSVTVYTYPGQW